jgi:peptide chain release factor 1
MEVRLRQALARAEEVAKTLADPSTASDPARLKALGREHTTLEPIVRLAQKLERLESELGQAREMALEADPELVALAKAELTGLTPQVESMRAELHELLLPRDPLDDRDAIVEIRAWHRWRRSGAVRGGAVSDDPALRRAEATVGRADFSE